MKNLKVYYLMDMDNEYLYHSTNEDEFIKSVLRYLKTELFEVVENYKTYILNQDEFLKEMERFIIVREKIKKCENFLQLKHIAMGLDYKVKTKKIDLN